MSVPNPPFPTSSSGAVSQNLTIAARALAKMQGTPSSPGVPPARFGAGGPMLVRSSSVL
jgi:hypothetical protein